MSFDAVPAKVAFRDYGLGAAKRFLKTAIVIDDEISVEPPSGETADELIVPPFSVNPAEQAQQTNVRGAAPPAARYEAQVQIKLLADAFLDKQIVCGVLKPEAADSDQQVIKRAVHAAKVADVVIIDWYLRSHQDKLALSILKEILQADQALNGRLRLIIVYTSADPLIERRSALAEHLRRAKFEPLEDPHDDTLLTIGDCRVRFVRKKSIDTGMPIRELPDFAIEEFAKHRNGLLANFALLGIAALRDATHHILSNLNKNLDIAFVGHRMLIRHDAEARGFAMNLFLLHLKGVLSLPEYLGGALSDEELSLWFDEHFGYQEAEAQLKGEGTTKDELREMVLKGTSKAEKAQKAHKALFLPASKDDPLRVGEVEKKISQDFARFSTFVRELDGFNTLPSDWMPTLTLGSVVKLIGRRTQYFLCVQPACDTVRIKEDRYFPFVELVTEKAAKSTENLVVRDGEKRLVVCVSTQAGSRVYEMFKPDASQTVRAESQDGKFLFSSTTRQIYWWLGDIDPLKAQRIATDVSGSLARVGIDEYEWLRRGGNAKK